MKRLWAVILVAPLFWGATGRAQAALAAAGSQPAEREAARALLKELVEINTTAAFGSTAAALAMAAHLRAAGFPEADVQIAGPRPDRQNLVVRLRGQGKARPILLIAHLDVVDAPREGWTEGLDPFRLTERGGFYYGRGVLDDKHAVAGLVASLMRLRREGFTPAREVIAALTADEEGGNANGVSWLLANQRASVDAAYCLNLDAGGGQIEGGRRQRMTVQTSEKTYMTFEALASSAGGHSSLPGKDNAIYRLSAALTRLAGQGFPFRFNATTRRHFERMSAVESGALSLDMRAVARDVPDLEAARRLAEASPYHNAILRTTCVATRLEAGHAENALPQTARATINCRAFPGDDADFVRDSLVRFLGDPEIRLTLVRGGTPAPESPQLPEVMAAVESLTRALWPGLPIIPVMDPWASDGGRLRREGIPTLGVSGTFGELDLGGAHGANERLEVASFDDGVEFLYRLLKLLTRGDGPAAP